MTAIDKIERAHRPRPRNRPAAAAKLREGNRLLLMAERLANLGHWRVDGGDGLLHASAQARRICGLRGEGAVPPRQALRIVAPPDRADLAAAVRRACRGETGVSCRIRLCRSDLKLRYLILDMHIDAGSGTSAPGLFGVVRDITDKVAAEETLTIARDEARAATLAKSEFLATMSHEIRTPMTGVMGMIELLRNNPPDEERERYLAAMKQSAELLMSVLDGILDFSKSESGKMELVCRDFDFEALATRTVDMFQNSASKKGLLFDLTVSTCTSHIAHGDPMRLQQVIANLISNAVKFTENGHIALSLRARRGQKGRQVWRVSVTDTGVGIDPEELGRLFEPFVQIGNRRSGGTGLGLAISRRLIEAMHGRTGVESVPGRGSTFWFEVELPVGTLAGPAADRPSRRVDNSPPLHVLVAEDNPINQMLIAALVRRLGHRVTCVDNGRRALEAAEAVSYDCILMDMQMPEMDGVSATRAIRSRGGLNAHVPIIALTADAAPERRRFYDSAGLTGFITKPVQVDALRRELAAVPRREDGADAELGGELPLDPKRIADLTAALGPLKVRGLLELMLTELKERPETIRAACASGELARARVEAHNLKGSATNMGAAGVGRAAKALELALPGAEVELAAARLDAEVRRARQALEALLRGSAEPSSRSA